MSAPSLARFGQVWQSHPETMGTMRYLVVSSDDYNDFSGDRRAAVATVIRGLIGNL